MGRWSESASLPDADEVHEVVMHIGRWEIAAGIADRRVIPYGICVAPTRLVGGWTFHFGIGGLLAFYVGWWG